MKRCGSSSGSDRPRDLQPPPVLSFITLITYLISLTLVLSCPWLGLAYPSHHLTLPGGDLSTIKESNEPSRGMLAGYSLSTKADSKRIMKKYAKYNKVLLKCYQRKRKENI
jgi:hypothetical protein